MKVLAFEDSVDIEALLVSGGIDFSNIIFKQYWDSENHLERISDFNPDVMMLEHYRPPTKGLDVLRNLLISELEKPKIVVAMSSASMANNAMLVAGADLGIVKFDIATLELWSSHS